MITYFENLLNFTCASIDEQVTQSAASAGVKKDAPKSMPIEAKYVVPQRPLEQGSLDDDVAALEKFFDVLQAGQSIEISLHDLLLVCPRPRRPRTDAYNALVRKLKQEMNVNLIISKNKTK